MALAAGMRAQDSLYARYVIDKLASPAMHGRGYVKHGEHKAASFISREFSKDGLASLSEKYFQPLHYSINTFPGKVSLKIDGQDLLPGRQYVVASSSPLVKGSFDIVRVPGDTIPREIQHGQYAGKFVLCRGDIRKLSTENPFGSAGIIMPVKAGENLWWHVSSGLQVQDFTLLMVREENLPDTARQVTLDVHSKFITNYETQNVVGLVRGIEVPDSFLVVTAHYDHLGMMGSKTYFPGANDNASGTAMLLDLARHYSLPEFRPSYSILFIACTGEEAGLMGSTWFASHPLIPLNRIRFLVNLDMVGTGSEGITVVNATVYGKEFKLMKEINDREHYLPEVASRGESCNSDHCPFYQKGVPSVFIYTRGKEFQEYHNVKDRAEDLPLTKYSGLFRLLTEFFAELQNGQ